MGVRIFKKDFLKEVLKLPWEGPVIEDTIVSQDRWSIQHELIFEYEGHFFSTIYSVGATETQPEMPWEYEDKVECVEVEKKLVQVEQWVEVE